MIWYQENIDNAKVIGELINTTITIYYEIEGEKTITYQKSFSSSSTDVDHDYLIGKFSSHLVKAKNKLALDKRMSQLYKGLE